MLSLRTSPALAGLLILLLGLAGCDLFGGGGDESGSDPDLSLEPGTFSAVVQGAVEEDLEGIATFSLDAGSFREPAFLLSLTVLPEAGMDEDSLLATLSPSGGIAFYRFQQEIPPTGTYDLGPGVIDSLWTFEPGDFSAFYFFMPEAGGIPMLFDAVSGTLTLAQAGEGRLGGTFEFAAASAPSGPIGSAAAADTVRVSGTFEATFLEVP